VGDDAQRSRPHALGLRASADRLGVAAVEMTTAYRMSAEIADWLNAHASATGIDAVQLVGIRPTGRGVREERGADPGAVAAELAQRWPNVATITSEDTWSHKGVEYDAVAVVASGMDPAQLYLAASRAAHELVVLR
jgi:hypothetical protein